MIEANIIAIITTERVSQKKSSLFCLLSNGGSVDSKKRKCSVKLKQQCVMDNICMSSNQQQNTR